MKQSTPTARFWSVLWLSVNAFIVLLPIGWLLLQSFKNRFDAIAVPPKLLFEPILSNYASVLSNTGFLSALRDSLVIAVGSVGLCLLLGVPFAYALARFNFRGKGDLAFFILSTKMLPPIVVIVPFIQIYSALHLSDTYFGLILAHVLVNLALVVWVMRGFFRGVPRELDEAALIDGCSPFQAFLRVVLPIARPGLISVTVLSLVLSWNELIFALSLTSFNLKTLPVYMATEYVGFLAVEWGALSAAGVLGTLPVVITIIFLQRYLVAGLSLGAVK